MYKKYWNKNTVSGLLQSTEFVKTRLDKLSTVVVEVASFVDNPVVQIILGLNIYIYIMHKISLSNGKDNKDNRCNNALSLDYISRPRTVILKLPR